MHGTAAVQPLKTLSGTRALFYSLYKYLLCSTRSALLALLYSLCSTRSALFALLYSTLVYWTLVPLLYSTLRHNSIHSRTTLLVLVLDLS